MKVDSGKYKGRKLIDNPYQHIRPTADVVKQSIFNKLAFDVVGASVLDLFCGTGALGIEALSRGAENVVMADKDLRSVKLTKDNLKNLKIDQGVVVLTGSYESVIKRLANKKLDIIILDPPYKSGVYENCLSLIYQNQLLSQNGVIVCEHDKKDKFDFSLFQILDEKIYGIKMVTYLTYKGEETQD